MEELTKDNSALETGIPELASNEDYKSLKKEATEAGYKTILEYLKSEGSRFQFDPKEYLTQLHKMYIDACSLGQKKAFSAERWNPVTDSFEDFLDETLKVITVRKNEVKEKRRLKEVSKPFPGLYAYGLVDMLEDLNPALEIDVDSEELDMYDEILELARKATVAYKHGEFALYEK